MIRFRNGRAQEAQWRLGEYGRAHPSRAWSRSPSFEGSDHAIPARCIPIGDQAAIEFP